MTISGIKADTMATYALLSSTASVEAVEQAEAAGVVNLKNEIADNQKQQAQLNDDLTDVGKTARKKKRFMRFRKNRQINRAKKKEAHLETDLKKTKGHHDRLLGSADSAIARIERGNELSQRLQKVLQQFQRPPAEAGE